MPLRNVTAFRDPGDVVVIKPDTASKSGRNDAFDSHTREWAPEEVLVAVDKHDRVTRLVAREGQKHVVS